jgi:hypothetical protein
MSGAKHRTVFWVASTYAVTTGAMAFALYVLAQVACMLFARVAGILQPGSAVPSVVLHSICLLLACLGGTWYSLRYIRKVALIDRPQACVVPAVVTFAVLAALALPLSFLVCVLCLMGLSTRGSEVLTYFVAMGILHALIAVVFAVQTKRGFARMAEHRQEPSQTA